MNAWGKWYLDTTGVDGFRLDAVKHIAAWFFPEWLERWRSTPGKELFVVGEYWTPDDRRPCTGISTTWGAALSVFGVPLHYAFQYASQGGGQVRHAQDPGRAPSRRCGRPRSVTFVDNHDSQPLQALESTVEPWFKPLAYAIILLRQEGYPCVFHPDYYGAEYEDSGATAAVTGSSCPRTGG